MNLAEVVETHARNKPDAEAVVHVAEQANDVTAVTVLTYAALHNRAQRAAAAILQHARPGSRALLLFPDGVEFSIAVMACFYAGVIAVPSPLPRGPKQQERVVAIARDCLPRVVLTCKRALEEAVGFADLLAGGRVPTVFVPTDDESSPLVTYDGHCSSNSLSVLQYTSGSTGAPKGIMLTHRNLTSNAMSLIQTFNLTADSKFGSWIPHFHDMGLMGQLFPAWFLGSSVTIMSPTAFLKKPVRWLRLIDSYDLAWSAAPDFAFELCTRRVVDDELNNLDLSRWRFASNGSEPVRWSTLNAFFQRFRAVGFRWEALNPCYGLAEATVFVSGTGDRGPLVKCVDKSALAAGSLREPATDSDTNRGHHIVSCGSVRDFEFAIVDPATRQVLPDGTIGELWLRGASVAAGYWGTSEANEDVFKCSTADGRDGYLRTGDLSVVEDGELYVTGRIKETIVVRGRNISPHDIESLVRDAVPELAGLFGAAFPAMSADEGEVVVLVHEVQAGTSADRLDEIVSEIRHVVAANLGVSVSAVQLVRRGSVARTTSGKVQRIAVRKAYCNRQTDPLISVGESTATFQVEE